MTESEYEVKEAELERQITIQKRLVADAKAALLEEARKLSVLENELAWLPVRTNTPTTRPHGGPQRYVCECPHEDCGSEFETTLTDPKQTTCCPECGRQQAPRILKTL